MKLTRKNVMYRDLSPRKCRRDWRHLYKRNAQIRFRYIFSTQLINTYSPVAMTHRIRMLIITRSSLNTWEP